MAPGMTSTSPLFLELVQRLTEEHYREVTELQAELGRLRAANGAFVTIAARFASANKALQEQNTLSAEDAKAKQTSDEGFRRRTSTGQQRDTRRFSIVSVDSVRSAASDASKFQLRIITDPARMAQSTVMSLEPRALTDDTTPGLSPVNHVSAPPFPAAAAAPDCDGADLGEDFLPMAALDAQLAQLEEVAAAVPASEPAATESTALETTALEPAAAEPAAAEPAAAEPTAAEAEAAQPAPLAVEAEATEPAATAVESEATAPAAAESAGAGMPVDEDPLPADETHRHHVRRTSPSPLRSVVAQAPGIVHVANVCQMPQQVAPLAAVHRAPPQPAEDEGEPSSPATLPDPHPQADEQQPNAVRLPAPDSQPEWPDDRGLPDEQPQWPEDRATQPAPTTSGPALAPAGGRELTMEPSWEWEPTGVSAESVVTVPLASSFGPPSGSRSNTVDDVGAVTGGSMERENYEMSLDDLAAEAAAAAAANAGIEKPDEGALEAACALVALISDDGELMKALEQKGNSAPSRAPAKDLVPPGLPSEDDEKDELESFSQKLTRCLEKEKLKNPSQQALKYDGCAEAESYDLHTLAQMTDLLFENPRSLNGRIPGPQPSSGVPPRPAAGGTSPQTEDHVGDTLPASSKCNDSTWTSGEAGPEVRDLLPAELMQESRAFLGTMAAPRLDPPMLKERTRIPHTASLSSAAEALGRVVPGHGSGGTEQDPTKEWRSILQQRGRKWRPDGDDRVSISMYLDPPQANVKVVSKPQQPASAGDDGIQTPGNAVAPALGSKTRGPGKKPICIADNAANQVAGQGPAVYSTPPTSPWQHPVGVQREKSGTAAPPPGLAV